jgi:hypothetical protein
MSLEGNSKDKTAFLPPDIPSSLTDESSYNYITVKRLHPTFGAEISGIDFTIPLTDEVFSDILAALNKVRLWNF